MATDRPPEVGLRAALAFGFLPADIRPLPGASRQSWRAGDYVLRVRPRRALRIELAALAAARPMLPVPGVLATAEFGDTSAALLETLPGTPAGRLDGISGAEAHARGSECARVHRLLGNIAAPDQLPAADQPRASETGVRVETTLLHLDVHPFNLLLDDGGQLSGVLDWANAARGDPELDRARTLSILTLDPAAMKRQSDPRWVALTQGWIDSADLTHVPRAARIWAYRYMTADLAQRYPTPQLNHIRVALAEAAGSNDGLQEGRPGAACLDDRLRAPAHRSGL